METSEHYTRISVAAIRGPSHQLRTAIDPAALGELADSMAAEGLHQPIGVRGPDADALYEIVWGHRRLLAARLLSWETIAARVFPPGFDPLLAAVSENLQRTDLNPLEEAHAVARFRERGKPLAEIARLFRRTPAWVGERLALLELPGDLQAVVADKTLPLAVVRILSDIDREDYRLELIREAIRSGATSAIAEVWRAHYLSDRERIIQNHMMVEEIVRNRASFVISYPCDWCGVMHPYEQTAGWRLCLGCDEQLVRARSTATPAT